MRYALTFCLLLLFLGCGQEREASIKVGMSPAEVVSILGAATHTERLPNGDEKIHYRATHSGAWGWKLTTRHKHWATFRNGAVIDWH